MNNTHNGMKIAFRVGNGAMAETDNGLKFIPEDELEKSPDDMIPVMRWRMSDLPDLFLSETRHLGTILEETFLGETGEWKDVIVGTQLTCTFELMRRADFDALEGWEA